MLTNDQAAAAQAAAIAQFMLDQNQTALAATLSGIFGQMATPATITDALTALTAKYNLVLNGRNALFGRGRVATINDLPTTANAGDVYICQADGDGYAFIAGVWINIGPFQGPAGANAATSFGFQVLGPFNAGELLGITEIPGPMTISPAGLIGFVNSPDASPISFLVQINGLVWGSVTFGAGSHNQITTTVPARAFLGGEVATLIGGSVTPATFRDFTLLFKGN